MVRVSCSGTQRAEKQLRVGNSCKPMPTNAHNSQLASARYVELGDASFPAAQQKAMSILIGFDEPRWLIK